MKSFKDHLKARIDAHKLPFAQRIAHFVKEGQPVGFSISEREYKFALNYMGHQKGYDHDGDDDVDGAVNDRYFKHNYMVHIFKFPRKSGDWEYGFEISHPDMDD